MVPDGPPDRCILRLRRDCISRRLSSRLAPTCLDRAAGQFCFRGGRVHKKRNADIPPNAGERAVTPALDGIAQATREQRALLASYTPRLARVPPTCPCTHSAGLA